MKQLELEQQEKRARQVAKQGWETKAQEKLWNDELDKEAFRSRSRRVPISSAAPMKKGMWAFILTELIVMQINANQCRCDKSSHQKIDSDQHKRPEDFPRLVNLFSILGLPHRKCHQRVGEDVKNLVFQRKTPEGEDVEAGIEKDEQYPVDDQRQDEK